MWIVAAKFLTVSVFGTCTVYWLFSVLKHTHTHTHTHTHSMHAHTHTQAYKSLAVQMAVGVCWPNVCGVECFIDSVTGVSDISQNEGDQEFRHDSQPIRGIHSVGHGQSEEFTQQSRPINQFDGQ